MAGFVSDDCESLLRDEKVPRRLETTRWHRLGQILFEVTTVICLVLLGVGLGVWLNERTSCVERTTYATPILRDVNIEYQVLKYNGTFMTENIYRQVGSPAVDAAWEELGVNYRSVRIPTEQARQAGLGRNNVQINPEYGGGFPANVEGLHHLHCLNLIRQGLYYNYNRYKQLGKGAFKNEENILRLHISHCVDILRQQLMCTVDVGVFGQVWYRPAEDEKIAAFVDFNTQHKCRNFDDVRSWAQQRQLPADVPSDFLLPPAPGTVIHEGVP